MRWLKAQGSRLRAQSGQAMLEYLIVFGVIAAATVVGAVTANQFLTGGNGVQTSMESLFNSAVSAIKP